jgi:molecular chaperone DnaK
MKYYVGIDLGTTNSAICSYDGENLRLYKSPEQHSVTPSAIHLDRRGNKRYGFRAYSMAAFDKDNTATLFKRLMGTSTPVVIGGQKMTPEECSAEILKVLFGYLPQEIRDDAATGTVITVPAAFNQMQRDATLWAARTAGIGQVALMQEPVAAVMCVMQARKSEGTFLVYDLGGGTFDIALAQSIAGRVSLLDHGGITMCGGRDFDLLLADNVVIPWLMDNFDLPEDLITNQRYSALKRMAAWACEQAKIDLSTREEATISLSETEVRIKDQGDTDIYFDISIDRKTLDELVRPRILDTIESTRELLTRARLSTHDIERVVFVGGPTLYKPLRDLVSFELGLPAYTQVDPMTAVAEGAALFAESIDWGSPSRSRKSSRGSISSGELNLSFDYIARTPDLKSRIAVKSQNTIPPGTQFQVDSLDTGWSSGRLELKNGASLEVMLVKSGENRFKIFVFDPTGGPIRLEQNTIVIVRTAATIDGIPASHSIGVAHKEALGSTAIKLRHLVDKGDALPKKGSETFRAEESLRSNGPGALVFNIYEGEIEHPVTDNWPVGCFKITGKDFEAGVIMPGDELICEYEISDSGRLSISVSVPKVGATFAPGHEFYSRQEGLIDYSDAGARVFDESERIFARVDDFSRMLPSGDKRLEKARNKLSEAQKLAEMKGDPHACKQGMENVYEAKRLLAQVRIENLSATRQSELENVVNFFQERIRELARPAEVTNFENMARTAQREIELRSSKFEDTLSDMKGINWQILWRQDWFVVDTYQSFCKEEYRFSDKATFHQLVKAGSEAIKRDDVEMLRKIVLDMYGIRISYQTGQDLMDIVNIL